MGLELSFVGLVGFKTIWRRESGAKKKKVQLWGNRFPRGREATCVDGLVGFYVAKESERSGMVGSC